MASAFWQSASGLARDAPCAPATLAPHPQPPRFEAIRADGAEYAELLWRHNTVAAEIVGTQEAVLFAHCWASATAFATAFGEFEWATRSRLHEAVPTEVRTSNDEEDAVFVGGCPIRWSPGAWNDMLRDVADDRLSSIVLLNPRSGEVYAAYDGGADVFVADPERVVVLKERWMAWLSTHPERL